MTDVDLGSFYAIEPRARFTNQRQVNYNELELQFKSISSNFIG